MGIEDEQGCRCNRWAHLEGWQGGRVRELRTLTMIAACCVLVDMSTAGGSHSARRFTQRAVSSTAENIVRLLGLCQRAGGERERDERERWGGPVLRTLGADGVGATLARREALGWQQVCGRALVHPHATVCCQWGVLAPLTAREATDGD